MQIPYGPGIDEAACLLAPQLTDLLANAECRYISRMKKGDHLLYKLTSEQAFALTVTENGVNRRTSSVYETIGNSYSSSINVLNEWFILFIYLGT